MGVPLNFYKNLKSGFSLQVLVPLSLHCGLSASNATYFIWSIRQYILKMIYKLAIPNAYNSKPYLYNSNIFSCNLIHFRIILKTFVNMTDFILCIFNLFHYNSYMFDCSCNLLECFNNRVIYFNNLFYCTCCLFFCRPMCLDFFSNLHDNTSDCNSCSCYLLAWTYCRILCTCNLFACSCRLFYFRTLIFVDKSINLNIFLTCVYRPVCKSPLILQAHLDAFFQRE